MQFLDAAFDHPVSNGRVGVYAETTNVQTNCLTSLVPGAIADALACDEHLAKTGTLIGPLHGLPVSVKEQIEIAGQCTNAGFAVWSDYESKKDAHMIKVLRTLGAVVFARTNQPQSLMQLETRNNLYGETVNPWNRNLSAGGSTGGEAALMAMDASVLGIGGDIGGSIRVPAGVNGVSKFPRLELQLLILNYLAVRFQTECWPHQRHRRQSSEPRSGFHHRYPWAIHSLYTGPQHVLRCLLEHSAVD